MRIALPLSLAALLFAAPVFVGPVFAAPAASGNANQTQGQGQSQSQARQTPAAKPGSTARQARGATTAPARSSAARPVATQQVAVRQGSAKNSRTAYAARGRNYAHGVEASHPGLAEPEGDGATPQVVYFPGATPSAMPAVLNGGPTTGVTGGYCGQMLMPAMALREVSRGFRSGHAGLDLMAPHGSPIRAAAAGSVIYAGWYYAYGNIVDIQHADGVVTRYAHMSAFARTIGAGASVAAGQEIGKVGATGRAHGPHVHFEVRLGGRAVDPRPFLALAPCTGVMGSEPIEEARAPERTRRRH